MGMPLPTCEQKIILYGRTEHAAENVFTDYVTPDHRHLADEAFENHHKNDIPFTYSLKQIGEDDRYIQHDVRAVREIIESLLIENVMYWVLHRVWHERHHIRPLG